MFLSVKFARFSKIFISALLLALPFLTLSAKDKKGVIMTVDDEEVPSEEFIYLFLKNNEQQTEPQTLEDYLTLFEVYRLKVAEAKQLGVDTTASFKKEIEGYKKDLLEPYITDTVFFNQLVDIAAERENTQVESSHIMIIRTNDAEKDKRNLELIDSLRTELLNGADFAELAGKYSEDRFSAGRGGYLGFTPAGTFPYGFETAEYDTPEGEISEVVESHVGWHLVKPGKRRPAMEYDSPAKSYDEIKAEVASKVTSPMDVRYKQIREQTIKNLKKRNPEVSVDDLSEQDAYNALIDAEKVRIYNSNPYYRNLVDEYVNGSLLYEVSVVNIWDKASNDTEGLQKFYEDHKDRYHWDAPHAKGILVQALNDSIISRVKEDVANLPYDSIVPYIKKNFKKEAICESFNVAKGISPIIDQLMFGGEKATPKYPKYSSSCVIDGRIVTNPENLDDVKSEVVNDYQEYLEKEWVNNLRKRHEVKINQKELGNIRKKLKK